MPALLTFLVFAFSVVAPSWTYDVTSVPDTVTYFAHAHNYYGSTGLLAHETSAAGVAFTALSIGDIITLDDNRYRVTAIERFTAVSPLLVASEFIGADGTRYGSLELGEHIYGRRGALILQTCYDDSRGRLFVIALPAMERRQWRMIR
jgi:hypothetical protein